MSSNSPIKLAALINEIPGIGLEVSYSPLSRDEDFYPIIFMNRNDEVYMTCRYYITKACRTFAIPSLQSTFSLSIFIRIF